MTFIRFNLVLLFRCPLIAPNLHFKMHEVRDASPIARQVTVSKYRQTQPTELVISLSTCSAIMYPNNRSAWKILEMFGILKGHIPGITGYGKIQTGQDL